MHLFVVSLKKKNKMQVYATTGDNDDCFERYAKYLKKTIMFLLEKN